MTKLLALLPLLLLLTVPAAPSKSFCAIWQTVKAGDTCWSMIQGKTNFKMEYLLSYNPGLNCDKLQVGQKLCMAQTGFPLPCKKNQKVAAGDTCFKIWTANGISDRQFFDWNDGIDCNKLQVGKEVCVQR